MKIKKLNILLLLVLMTLSVTSCFEDDDEVNKYDGPALVEFNSPTLTTSSYVNVVADGSGLVTEQVNLIAPQFGNAQAINFSVAPESTAVEGTHYTTSGQFTIAANTSTGDASVQILDGSIPAGESRTLILVLEGNDAVGVSENYKSVTIRIEP